MDKRFIALGMLKDYKRIMDIDYFAIAEQASGNVNLILIDADSLIEGIEGYFTNHTEGLPSLITLKSGEEFFRLTRSYHAVKMWQGLQGVRRKRIQTNYNKINDIPEYKGMRARGWEIVTADVVHGKHTGDDINEVDVISDFFGRIECKFGNGRIYTSANPTEKKKEA